MKRFLFNLSLFLSLFGLVIPGFSQGQQYALIIGITGYPKYTESKRLRYADDDALLFYDFIQSKQGGNFSEQNIRLLINQDATRRNILDNIVWMGRLIKSEDIVYIFFAGHGELDDCDRAYFMPFDADPERPEDRGIRTDQFIEEIKVKINSKYMIFFIDACYAASVNNMGLSRSGGGNITRSLNQIWANKFKGQNAISIAFYSAASNQFSYEDPKIAHGLFTYYLMQGMKNCAADVNSNGEKDGIVTAGDLYRYVLDKVKSHAQNELNGRYQSPTKSPGFSPSFPLATCEGNINILKNNSEISRKHFNRGNEFYEKGNYAKAIKEYNEAIRIDLYNAELHNNLGLALRSIDDLDGAIEEYKEAIRLEPNYTTPHNNLGVAFIDKGEFDQAINEFRAAIRNEPYYLDAYINLGIVLKEKGDFKDSAKEFYRAIRIDPYHAKAHNNLGVVLKAKGYKKAAIKEFRTAIGIDPNLVDAYNNLGDFCNHKLPASKFEKSDAAMVIAGMYLGQYTMTCSSLPTNSDKVRDTIKSYLKKTGINSKKMREIDNLLKNMAQRNLYSDALEVLNKVVGILNTSFENINPAFGRKELGFGFFFGIAVMCMNAIVDYPDNLSPQQKSNIMENLQNLFEGNMSKCLKEVKKHQTRIPFPPCMAINIERMFTHDTSTLKGCEQVAVDAVFFSFLLWRISDVGSHAILYLQPIPKHVYAYQMSQQLEIEGFYVKLPGLRSRRPLLPE